MAVNTNKLSIVQKLGLLLALAVLMAVFMNALVFTVGTGIGRYQETLRQLGALAKAAGENSRATLAFKDVEGARATLEALRIRDDIEFARLIDAQGSVFAQMDLGGTHGHWQGMTGRLAVAVVDATLPVKVTVGESIQDEDRTIGRIELDVELYDLWFDLFESLTLMVLIAIVLSSLGVYFSWRLSRFITNPILELTEVSHQVAREQD